MENREQYFCLKCGERTFSPIGQKKLQCKSCGFELYRNAAAAVAAVIRCGDEILVGRRASDPHKGLLDLPGGFVDPCETLEQGLARELLEEVGLPIRTEELRYLRSGVNTYPYGGFEYYTTDAFFALEYAQKPKVKAMDDLASVEWLKISDLKLDEFAFGSQQELLRLHYLS